MLGEPNAPMQLSSGALTTVVPAMFLPITPLFQPPRHADQMWPGIIVTSPTPVKGPGPLRLRSRVNSSRILTWLRLDSEVAWNAPVALRLMRLYFTSHAVTGAASCQWLLRLRERRRSAVVLAKYVAFPYPSVVGVHAGPPG